MKFKKYRSGYHCFDYDYLKDLGESHKRYARQLNRWTSTRSLKGDKWNVSFQKVTDDPSFRNAKEAIINALSIVDAQRASNLICAAQYLLDGTDIFGAEPNHVIPVDVYERDEFNNHWMIHDKRMSDQIPKCCAIAAKASMNLSTENALSKYQLSCNIFSSHYRDIDTFYADEPALSPYAYDHVRLAYAIVIAYSVIEELNLEVRVKDKVRETEKNGVKVIIKEKESSRLPNGEWNPSVKQDMEQRLLFEGINLGERFHWTVRGAETPLEKKRNPEIIKKWRPETEFIRDGEIELIDAIGYASWLRSRISSHKVSDRAKLLTVFEVFNVQSLARRLLLEKLRFWRKL